MAEIRGRKVRKLREIGVITGVVDDVRQNIKKGMIKNDQFKNQRKVTEKTARRTITQCQDKENFPKSTPSPSSTTETPKHSIHSLNP